MVDIRTMIGFYFICVLMMSSGVFSNDMEDTEMEQISDEEGHVYNLNITHKPNEEDIDVHDVKGNHIITVEMMENEGYQIDKPANESVCLLSKFEEMETIDGDPDSTDTENKSKHLCYDRVMYSELNISQQLQDHCAERDIYVLVPKNCSGDERNAVETEQSEEDGSRVKRGLIKFRCCWRYFYTLRYCRYKFCCWWCRRTCYGYKLCWVRVYYLLSCGFFGC